MANPLTLFGGPNGSRTRVTDVRGQCPRPLDDGTIKKSEGIRSKTVLNLQQNTPEIKR